MEDTIVTIFLRISKTISLALIVFFALTSTAFSYDKVGRLGLGFSNQLKNDFPGFSFKMQKNRSFAFGGIVGFNSASADGGYGAGIKVFRNIFDEPQSNFYIAGLGALLSNKVNGTAYSGFQFDLSFGSEFHLSGINSIGFSFEFGVSANKKQNFAFQTLGNSFIVSGIHFYL